MRSTISVLCPTAHSGPLVAESLGALRDAVAEIVVAADARVGATDLAYYADVADVLVRYEYSGANRHWPWLAQQARGDWVLLLDGDELPSAALVAALPDLVADRRVRQYSLPIHWLWPAPDFRLAEEPWGSDRRLRLMRNDAGLAFAARKHELACVNPPVRYLNELPVYHLDLLLPDRARREAKAARYDRESFGLLTSEGVPFNQAFYLPEAGDGDRATVPLPAEDADRITRALSAPRDPRRCLGPASVPLHSRAAIAWHAPQVALPADAYRATIALAKPLPQFTAGRRDHVVWVEVTNEGTAHWPGRDGHDPLIRLGVKWQSMPRGSFHEVGRELLPHALGPGQRALFPVAVCAPPLRGSVELVLDLVHEHVRWFGRAFRARVEIEPSVDERLAALAQRHGPLIPHEALIEERRAVGLRDGLLRHEPPGAAPADPRIAELTASLPVGTWALDGATIDRLVELVRGQRPPTIVEFGSGTSTVVLAALLAERYRDGPRLVTFEQDSDWAERTREALAERGLDSMAMVIKLPLGERADGPPGYLLTEQAAELLADFTPSLVVVDGPTRYSGASRLGTVELIAPYLREDVTLLLDDALRDSELSVAAAWERRGDVVLHGVRLTAKGLLEATLRAPARHQPALAESPRGHAADVEQSEFAC